MKHIVIAEVHVSDLETVALALIALNYGGQCIGCGAFPDRIHSDTCDIKLALRNIAHALNCSECGHHSINGDKLHDAKFEMHTFTPGRKTQTSGHE